MQAPEQQLFVYGSLRSGFQHPAYSYISRYFTLEGEAKVRARLYDMGDYPAAVPADNDVFVIGELYRINHPDELPWALAQLDDYEGVHAEPEPLYRREKAEVITPGGNVTAWIYWYNGDTSGKPEVESGDVLEYMKGKNKL